MADLDGFFAKKGKKKKKKPTLQNLEDAAELGQSKQEDEKTQPIVVALSNPPEVNMCVGGIKPVMLISVGF